MNHPRYPRAKVKGHLLRARGVALGLSIGGIAERAKLTRQYVQKLSSGRECPLETAEQIAKVLDCGVAELFDVIQQRRGSR